MVSVLFLAYYFPPAGGAGVQRSEKFVRYLPSEGFLPIVVTGPGSSGDRWSPEDTSCLDESLSTAQVFRAVTPIPQESNRWSSRLGRWIDRPSPFSNWWANSAASVGVQSINSAKLIFATMSPFSTALAAQEISRQTGVPWVADLRDPWALDEMQIYPSLFHRRLETRRMGRALSTAAGIVMNTPEAKAALLETFPFLKKKPVTTITNGYDAADFDETLPPRRDGKFRVVHTGYLHTDLGLQTRRRRRLRRIIGGAEPGVDILTRSHVFLLEAVEGWINQRPQVANNLELIFAGVVSDQDKAAVEESTISYLTKFTGYISHTESVRLIRTADLLFLPMHNLGSKRRSRIVPGKTYEYMAAERPILAAVPEGDARNFLRKSGTAFLSEPDDVSAMIEHLNNIYSAWENGHPMIEPDRGFIKQFERTKLTHQLATFFTEILGSQSPLNAAPSRRQEMTVPVLDSRLV